MRTLDEKRRDELLAMAPIEAWLREKQASTAGVATVEHVLYVAPPMADAVRAECASIALQLCAESDAFWPTGDHVIAAIAHFDLTDAIHDRIAELWFECDVCCARPDAEGDVSHGRGCYTQHEDGGGTSHEEEMDRSRDPREVARRARRSMASYRAEHGVAHHTKLTSLVVQAARVWQTSEICTSASSTGAQMMDVHREDRHVVIMWTPSDGFFGGEMTPDSVFDDAVTFRTHDEAEAIRELDKILTSRDETP
jgi:hypothetical protein